MTDTGPDYPPDPLPGSNAIGVFEIGVSPVGTISPFNFWNTVQQEFANSGTLTTLLANFNAYLDQTQNFDSFYDLMWNVATAQGYGLDVWGRIVGATRTLEVSNSDFLGFEEAGDASANPFNQAPFYSGSTSSSSYQLSDAAFRVLIYAKALSNICDGSIPAINAILLTLFPGQGDCYVTNGENMTMTYTFDFELTPVQSAIISQTGVLPTPTGVVATIVIGA